MGYNVLPGGRHRTHPVLAVCGRPSLRKDLLPAMLDHGSLDSSSADPVQALRHRMRHSASHVMADAVLKLFPEAKMGIGPPTQEGFYDDFEVSRPFTPEDLERIDPLVNAIWATSWCIFPDGRTFLDGVTLLEQGCFARFEEDRPLQVGRYWHPRPQHVPWPTLARAREHTEPLRALLLAKLARDLDPTGGNLLTLSGGVDSSSLAALAAGTVGRPV